MVNFTQSLRKQRIFFNRPILILHFFFFFAAVKSNPDINIVRALKFLGTGFDCASQAELEEVMSIGATPGEIIFANPCKGKGILSTTFPSSDQWAIMMLLFNCNTTDRMRSHLRY